MKRAFWGRKGGGEVGAELLVLVFGLARGKYMGTCLVPVGSIGLIKKQLALSFL